MTDSRREALLWFVQCVGVTGGLAVEIAAPSGRVSAGWTVAEIFAAVLLSGALLGRLYLRRDVIHTEGWSAVLVGRRSLIVLLLAVAVGFAIERLVH